MISKKTGVQRPPKPKAPYEPIASRPPKPEGGWWVSGYFRWDIFRNDWVLVNGYWRTADDRGDGNLHREQSEAASFALPCSEFELVMLLEAFDSVKRFAKRFPEKMAAFRATQPTGPELQQIVEKICAEMREFGRQLEAAEKGSGSN